MTSDDLSRWLLVVVLVAMILDAAYIAWVEHNDYLVHCAFIIGWGLIATHGMLSIINMDVGAATVESINISFSCVIAGWVTMAERLRRAYRRLHDRLETISMRHDP